MKQIMQEKESLLKTIQEKWHYTPNAVMMDGTKYGHPDENAHIVSRIFGITTPRELMEAEYAGAIVYQYGEWRVSAEPSVRQTSNGGETSRAKEAYNNYIAEKKMTPKQRKLFEERKAILTKG